MPVRVSRVERAAANHAAVLDAARVVFLRAGYHGATVEAVAAEAGFTIGAVYSRFRGKAELFLALLEQRITERIGQLRALAATVPPPPPAGPPARPRAPAPPGGPLGGRAGPAGGRACRGPPVVGHPAH